MIYDRQPISIRKEPPMAKNVYLVMEFKAGNNVVGVESAWSSFKKASDYVNFMLETCGDEYYYKSQPGEPDQTGKKHLTIFEQEVDPFEHIASSHTKSKKK
jgi:hypothetical protein